MTDLRDAKMVADDCWAKAEFFNIEAAAAIIEQQAARIAELTEALRITLNILDEAYRNYGTEFDREDTAKAQTARAALGDKQ